jgi:radical SAM protein with 4Fe4S-binding SPASM domain
MTAIERCQSVGLEVTVLATLMSTNFDQMEALARLAADLGTNLRVNAYQPVQTRDFTPSYEEFWEGYRSLLAAAPLVSTSEPIVNAVLGLDDLTGSPCGRQSIRFTPRGEIIPCVYWPDRDLTIADLPELDERRILDSDHFVRARVVPPACVPCPHVNSCGGGCASRRALLGALQEPDPYCPYQRGEHVKLNFAPAPAKDLPRARNVCTTIVAT